MKIDAQRFFPYPFRDEEQRRVCQLIIDNFHDYDVFGLILPVAFGKTAIGKMIMNYSNYLGLPAGIVAPDNALVRQGKDEFPDLAMLGLKSSFPNEGAFIRAKEEAINGPQSIINPYTLLANRVYKPVVIFDEAHMLERTLQDLGGLIVWEGSKQWHPGLQNITQAIVHFSKFDDAKSKKLVQTLAKKPDEFCLAYGSDLLRGQEKRQLRVYQLTPKNERPVLWPPNRTKKLFFMSATLSRKDIEELGADRGKRVMMIHARSSIPVQRRRFVCDFIGDMTFGNTQRLMPKAIDKIFECMDEYPTERGFIHATYPMASRIRGLMGTGPEDRLRFHTKYDKRDSLSDFMTIDGPEDNRVFVGSGLAEGLNLKYDLARWQVILQCQSPSLADPAVARKVQLDPEWYDWVTIRTVLQAHGRVSRAPDDFGETRMLDRRFSRIYNRRRHLFPEWFTECVS